MSSQQITNEESDRMLEEHKGETLQQHASEARIDLNPALMAGLGANSKPAHRRSRPHASSFNEGDQDSVGLGIKGDSPVNHVGTPNVEGNQNPAA